MKCIRWANNSKVCPRNSCPEVMNGHNSNLVSEALDVMDWVNFIDACISAVRCLEMPPDGKGKASPLQAMHVQRGLGELRLLDVLTTALYGGKLSALRTDRLYPQGYSWYSFSLGAESTPEPWFGRKEICH